MAANKSTTTDAAHIVFALIVEGVGVGIVTMVAGISNEMANIMLIFVMGLWLLFLIKHATSLGVLDAITGQANKAVAG